MNKLTTTLAIAFLLIINYSFSQTLVHGGIYSNTTWSLANSPYVMDGSVVVFPGVTLTIEPGVEVRVKENGYSGDQYYLETRGTIKMIGKPGALISFRANTAVTSSYSWMGILVKNSQGGELIYDYASISNALYAIRYDSFIPRVINLNQCVFSYNTNALGVGVALQADSCSFVGNQNAVYGWSIFKLTNCVFDGNTEALPVNTSELEVENCSFINNTSAIRIGNNTNAGVQVKNTLFDNNGIAFENANNGIVDSCTFTNNLLGITYTNNVQITNSLFSNNQTALMAGWGTLVSNCDIKDNSTGIAIGPLEYGQAAPTIENNRICSNTAYNIDNQTDLNMFIPTNCFCLSDSTEIEEKILDGYDDITKGLISYAIYDTSCNIILKTVNKQPNTSVTENPEKKSLEIYPNPFTDFLNINNTGKFAKAEVLDLRGKQVLALQITEGKNSLDLSVLPAGAYILRMSGNAEPTEFARIIKR